MSVIGFQMWEPFRQSLMVEHCFYVDQARKRLLSQFANIEAEADKAAEEHLERMSIHFNPDVHDSSDLYESANEKGIEFYQLLSGMHDNTRLSVTAGMYHQWDKNLRDWIVQEMRHWHPGVNASRSIWRADFSAIVDFLVAIGIDPRRISGYAHLNAMRLVVNVFKHGDGSSLDELKASYPEFLPDLLGDGEHRIALDFLDHTHLKLSDLHLEQFSEAILSFWKAIPRQIYLSEVMDVPSWFEKAVLKDRKTL